MYNPGDIVFVIDDSTVKEGVIQLVEINISDSGTTIEYWILVEGETTTRSFLEDNVYASCRAAPGFQDIVFDVEPCTTLGVSCLDGSPSPIALDANSEVFMGSPFVGTGSPLGIDTQLTIIVDGMIYLPIELRVEIDVTFADIVDSLNALIEPFATASLYQNNIRITSATTGVDSSIEIRDGVLLTGSPIGSP